MKDLSCVACGSVDTVSYWHKADDSLSVVVLRDVYPRARRCVDCEYIEHDPGRRPAMEAIRNLMGMRKEQS